MKEQWAKCGNCGKQYGTGLMLPMELGQFARYLKVVRCPACDAPPSQQHLASEKLIESITATDEKGKLGQWLVAGDTGVSSKSLAACSMGAYLDQRDVNAPYDPADLGRCLRLIALVPSVRQSVDVLAARFPDSRWAIAAKCWDEISDSMKEEVGIYWSKGRNAPKTYDLMKARGL